jgi:hypothetical protein
MKRIALVFGLLALALLAFVHPASAAGAEAKPPIPYGQLSSTQKDALKVYANEMLGEREPTFEARLALYDRAGAKLSFRTTIRVGACDGGSGFLLTLPVTSDDGFFVDYVHNRNQIYGVVMMHMQQSPGGPRTDVAIGYWLGQTLGAIRDNSDRPCVSLK